VNTLLIKIEGRKRNETYFVENEAQSLIFPELNEDFGGWYTG